MSSEREVRWDRLQREYRRAVSLEYPNPERKNCLAADACAISPLARRAVKISKD
jgi:hypothetical protein